MSTISPRVWEASKASSPSEGGWTIGLFRTLKREDCIQKMISCGVLLIWIRISAGAGSGGNGSEAWMLSNLKGKDGSTQISQYTTVGQFPGTSASHSPRAIRGGTNSVQSTRSEGQMTRSSVPGDTILGFTHFF